VFFIAYRGYEGNVFAWLALIVTLIGLCFFNYADGLEDA
jgi:hypothetical protein